MTDAGPAEIPPDPDDFAFEVVPEPDYLETGGHFGGGQVIYRRPDGTLVGGSDPRKDGQAVGF